MTCEVAASRKALAAGRARERFGRACVRRWPTARLLVLIWRLLLVRVVRGRGDVVVVVEQRHRGLHLGGRGIAHAVHVLAGHGRVRGQLLRLLRRVTRRI